MSKVSILGETVNSDVDPERLPEQSYLNQFLFYSSFCKACETCPIARYVSTKYRWFLMVPNDFAVEILVEVFLASLVYPFNTCDHFPAKGHHAKLILFPPIFPLNYFLLDVIFNIKSGCCDENSAFESRKA
uniref:Putative ovule protein n=1 Tax=Solanum chacoense TaxID=4108 RepID=A0A0V0HJP6_SOLCH